MLFVKIYKPLTDEIIMTSRRPIRETPENQGMQKEIRERALYSMALDGFRGSIYVDGRMAFEIKPLSYYLSKRNKRD